MFSIRREIRKKKIKNLSNIYSLIKSKILILFVPMYVNQSDCYNIILYLITFSLILSSLSFKRIIHASTLLFILTSPQNLDWSPQFDVQWEMIVRGTDYSVCNEFQHFNSETFSTYQRLHKKFLQMNSKSYIITKLNLFKQLHILTY